MYTQKVVDFITQYEGEGFDSDDEVVAGFQMLIDCGVVWSLQGAYGRMAHDLIASGQCHPPRPRNQNCTSGQCSD